MTPQGAALAVWAGSGLAAIAYSFLRVGPNARDVEELRRESLAYRMSVLGFFLLAAMVLGFIAVAAEAFYTWRSWKAGDWRQDYDGDDDDA